MSKPDYYKLITYYLQVTQYAEKVIFFQFKYCSSMLQIFTICLPRAECYCFLRAMVTNMNYENKFPCPKEAYCLAEKDVTYK